MDLKLTVINILSSSIFAALLTFYLNRRKEEKQYKKLLLDDIVGYSYQITENFKGGNTEFIHAINRIFIVYNSDKEVIDSLKKYKENSSVENLLYLIKAMCKVVNISQKQIIDNFLINPFIANANKEMNPIDYSDLY